MKHFKLFLLPLLALTLVFSSCEKKDPDTSYFEPIQEWGKSQSVIKEEMSKTKTHATISEEDDEYLLYENYGISDNVMYNFENGKLNLCTTTLESTAFKQTILDYFSKGKFFNHDSSTIEDINYYLYSDLKSNSLILIEIDENYGYILAHYIPYQDIFSVEEFLSRDIM